MVVLVEIISQDNFLPVGIAEKRKQSVAVVSLTLPVGIDVLEVEESSGMEGLIIGYKPV